MLAFLRNNAPYLAAGSILTFASSFGQTYFISIFAGEIRAGFGLSHGQWGGIYATATTCSAILMVWAGTLTDRYRVRILGPICLLFLALACVGMAVSTWWVALGVVVFLLRFFGQGMLSHIAVVAMARWYVARRGKAIAFAGLGYALGEACLPLLFVLLMGLTDWRSLWVVAAVICLLLVPVVRALLRLERTPRFASEREDSAGMGSRHWTRSEVLRHPLFWVLVPAVAGPGAFITALFFHQVHIADVKGWAHIQLVALFPIYTGTGVVAMLVTGWALDKWGTSRLIPYSQIPISIGFVLIWMSDDLLGAGLGYMVIGISHGAYATLFAAFWAEYYGTRYLGGVKSMVAALMVLGSAIGPGLTGFLIDAGSDFVDQMPYIAVYFVGASILVWLGVSRARTTLPQAA